MWEQVDSILAHYLEKGDVVKVPDADSTIVHVRNWEWWGDRTIIIYGTDDEWGEEFEYSIPDTVYLPLMLPVE